MNPPILKLDRNVERGPFVEFLAYTVLYLGSVVGLAHLYRELMPFVTDLWGRPSSWPSNAYLATHRGWSSELCAWGADILSDPWMSLGAPGLSLLAYYLAGRRFPRSSIRRNIRLGFAGLFAVQAILGVALLRMMLGPLVA